MMNRKETWNQIIRNLEVKLKKSEIETWFSPTTLEQLDNERAVIGVPNIFFANRLKENYLYFIKNSFKETLKIWPKVQFACHPVNMKNTPAVDSNDHGTFIDSKLNPLMTFERFFRSEFNGFAYASAMEVAEKNSTLYNPLFIYAGSGLGKSHLLYAIGNYRVNKNLNDKVRYISSLSFLSELSGSIKNGNRNLLASEYGTLDLFLFDDIHLLAHRKKAQEEFISLFDVLFESKKQIVISGDGPPKKLEELSPELRSRLGWGLLAEIRYPSNDMKIELIKKIAQEEKITLPEDIMYFLATMHRDVKNLIHSIIRIETSASIQKGKMTLSLARTVMKEEDTLRVGIEEIMTCVSHFFHISLNDMTSNKRNRHFSYPRQLAMYLTRKYTQLSYKDIGHHFGSRDHSTVIHAMKQIELWKTKNEKITEDLKKIENLLFI